MKHSIKIIIDKELTSPKYVYSIAATTDVSFELDIYTNGTETLDELFSNSEAINQAIKEGKNEFIYFEIKCDVENASDINYDNIQYIKFDVGSYSDLFDINIGDYYPEDIPSDERCDILYNYLMKHDEYKDKPIVVPDSFNVSTNIEEIKARYKDFKYIYVKPDEEFCPIKIEDASVGNDLNKLVDSLKKLNLSPLEYSILVYDLVREKPYQFENEGESAAESRELYKVMNGDSIVCVGYSALYIYIMHLLGINTFKVALNGTNGHEDGHARVVSYIKDEKYNVDGIFFSDPTFDSREKDDEQDYLYRYKYFMKKIHYFDNIDEEYNIKNFSFENIDQFKDIDEIINESGKDLRSCNSFKEMNRCASARKILTKLVLFFEDYDVFSEDNQLLPNLGKKYKKEIVKAWNSEIDMTTFTKALFNVRAIENSIDSNKYKLDFEEMYRRSESYGFNMDEEAMLNYIRDGELLYIKDKKMDVKNVINIMNNLAGEKRIKRISENYTYILQKEMEKINNSNKDEYKVVESMNLYKKGTINAKKGN